MRKLALLAALVPSLVVAQGVSRPVRLPEATLLTLYRGSAIANGSALGIFVLPPSRGFTVTGIAAHVTGAAAGAGTGITMTVTDGTRTCTFAISCTATGTAGAGDTGGKRFAPTSGTCAFPGGAALFGSVTSAGCGATQPTILWSAIVGTWDP